MTSDKAKILCIVFVAALAGAWCLFEGLNFSPITPGLFLAKISAPVAPEKTNEFTMLFVGDIMLDRGVEYKIKKYSESDWRFPFLKIADYLENNKTPGILIGNLEGPISDKGEKVGSIYSFRADPRVIDGLTHAGFDVLSLANNHLLDYGRLALIDTFARLSAAGIQYVGAGNSEAEAYSPAIKEVNGTRVAFLAYTNLGPLAWKAMGDKPGMALYDKLTLQKAIAAARQEADIVIVMFHFGNEYQMKSSALQQEIARFSIDSGADLVVGHHPHVSQEVEEYQGKYVAYSLGNFVFDQSFSPETMQGLILKATVNNGEISQVSTQKTQINEYFQPQVFSDN